MRRSIHLPAIARRAIAGALTLTSACSDPIAPEPLRSPGAAVLRPSATRGNAELEAFIAKQGTFCDDVVLPCTPGFPDIGYVIAQWEYVGGPSLIVDAFGTNARWYPKHFGPVFPAFEYEGSLSENRLPDGRRRVLVHIRSRNTFTALYDTDLNPILGADFTEYDSRLPILATATANVELALPADYVGYADILEILAVPKPGMEVLRYSMTVETRGVLRADFEGIAAGTEVDVTLRSTWLPRHWDIKGVATGIVRGDYAPGTNLTVTPAK